MKPVGLCEGGLGDQALNSDAILGAGLREWAGLSAEVGDGSGAMLGRGGDIACIRT